MVIMNGIMERDVINPALGINCKGTPYICLVDNEQDMMLIIRNRLMGKSAGNKLPESSDIHNFVTEKVHSLFNRISSHGPLTERETEVLNYAAQGKSNKQIAECIGLSESTVKNHFSSTLRKLQANDRTHAVILALNNGWIDATDVTPTVAEENED
jgi:DNA-binding NarL/FixJ family response regulator